jgi:hypothetical protein
MREEGKEKRGKKGGKKSRRKGEGREANGGKEKGGNGRQVEESSFAILRGKATVGEGCRQRRIKRWCTVTVQIEAVAVVR